MTDAEICTAALSALAVKGIQSLDDDNDAARAAKAFYALVRDKVLEDHLWSFAKCQYVLTPEDDAPLFGFTHQFQVPADVARVFRVDDGSGDYRASWDLQGRRILADFEKAYVTAVTKEADTSLYSPGFCLALSLRLAAVLAVPLKENRQLKADLLQEYKYELGEAVAADGTQGKSEQVRSDWLARARG